LVKIRFISLQVSKFSFCLPLWLRLGWEFRRFLSFQTQASEFKI